LLSDKTCKTIQQCVYNAGLQTLVDSNFRALIPRCNFTQYDVIAIVWRNRSTRYLCRLMQMFCNLGLPVCKQQLGR